MTTLVTFGCSWTWGKCSFYDHSMSREEYLKQFRTPWGIDPYPERYSFRSILAKKYNLKVLNFARGGSSNQKQFRYATHFFNLPIKEKMIVLWGITSTARDEMWLNDEGKWSNCLYGNAKDRFSDYSRMVVERYYDHEVEVYKLNEQMKHWNTFFNHLGIKNVWFDTLNHHNYTDRVPNLCWRHQPNRDLLSRLCMMHGPRYIGDDFHHSVHTDDCDRIRFLLKKKKVNPYTFHPTSDAHRDLAKLLDPYVKSMLD
tara:strand:+ start:476 stop:1243 length:768 start_codon:yes stop_codon:yes gene_type:complete